MGSLVLFVVYCALVLFIIGGVAYLTITAALDWLRGVLRRWLKDTPGDT